MGIAHEGMDDLDRERLNDTSNVSIGEHKIERRKHTSMPCISTMGRHYPSRLEIPSDFGARRF